MDTGDLLSNVIDRT